MQTDLAVSSRETRIWHQIRRGPLTLAVLVATAIAATITVVIDAPAAFAQPDIPCEQWQQMHPGWPCIPVPKPPPPGPPTTPPPLPTAPMPGQPPTGTGGGSRAGALTPPPVGPGNGTAIVPVPGQPEPAPPSANQVPVPPTTMPAPFESDRTPVRDIPGTPQPAPVTPQPPPGPKEVWTSPRMNGIWYQYEKTTLLDTNGYTPQGASPVGTCSGDSSVKQCTIGQGQTITSSVTTQNEIGASLGWSGEGVNFTGNISHSTANTQMQSVAITVGCTGDAPAPGSVFAGYPKYRRQQFVIDKYLMPSHTFVDRTYGEGLFPESSLACRTVPAGNTGWK